MRRELRTELPGQTINLSIENDSVFLRGRVRDMNSADRAMAIASTLGKPVNLLYVDVPPAETQILLKVKFTSIDRSTSTQLGLNIASTGAAGNIGTVSTGQFPGPTVARAPETGITTLTVQNALNIFLFRPDINLAATIQALQARSLLEVLAEPNVLAMNGRQASFLAGGEFPFPTIQGGGAGLGQVTIQFREFGIRLNFIPTITPRGTIRLQVAPEVSSLDFAGGLLFQGVTVPAISTRRVNTEIELEPGQSFAIGGLLDNRMQKTVDKIPFLGDIPWLGKLFQSKNESKNNTELLVLVTPELVRPIPAGQRTPELNYPGKFLPPNSAPDATRTPGLATTGPVPVTPATEAMPIESLRESLRPEAPLIVEGKGGSTYPPQPQQSFFPVIAPAAPAAPAPAAPAPAAAPPSK